jgi:DNA-binding CsgD family transcriptional regulator
MASRVDEIDIAETMYSLEGTIESWLESVSAAVMKHLNVDLGCSTVVWSARGDGTYHRHPVFIGMDDAIRKRFDDVTLPAATADFLIGWASSPFDGLVETLPPDHPFRRNFEYHLSPLGVRDSLKFVAMDTPACLVSISPVFEKPLEISNTLRGRYGRLAAHLASALRLRRRCGALVESEFEATLDSDGNVLHALGGARSSEARELLRSAVCARERARTRRTRADADEALALWQGLIAGQWSLIDRFERDGRRFVVAYRNENVPRDPRALTPREEQIAQLAARGRSNHEIAYALGIGAETVSTHLKRALGKLRCTGRAELIQMARSAHFQFTWSDRDDVIGVLVDGTRQAPMETALSPAEREVFEGISAGKSNEQIALGRGTTVRTVANQVASILRKTGAPSRYALMNASSFDAFSGRRD